MAKLATLQQEGLEAWSRPSWVQVAEGSEGMELAASRSRKERRGMVQKGEEVSARRGSLVSDEESGERWNLHEMHGIELGF